MATDDLQKHTLNLRSGDWAYLESVLNPAGVHTSTFIRKQISRIVDSLRSGETPLPQLTLPLKGLPDE